MQLREQWRQWLTKNHPLTSNKVNKCLLSAHFLLLTNSCNFHTIMFLLHTLNKDTVSTHNNIAEQK